MLRIFHFVQILSNLQKLKKDLISAPSHKPVFYIFIDNSRYNQNLKDPEHAFLDIAKEQMCAKF